MITRLKQLALMTLASWIAAVVAGFLAAAERDHRRYRS
jgi:hypothetical protein